MSHRLFTRLFAVSLVGVPAVAISIPLPVTLYVAYLAFLSHAYILSLVLFGGAGFALLALLFFLMVGLGTFDYMMKDCSEYIPKDELIVYRFPAPTVPPLTVPSCNSTPAVEELVIDPVPLTARLLEHALQGEHGLLHPARPRFEEVPSLSGASA